MKLQWSLAAAVLVLALACSALAAQPELLTLEAALARAEWHSDYRAWLKSLEAVEDTLEGIQDRYRLGMELSGSLLRLSHNFSRDSTRLDTAGGLSFSKSTAQGTTFSGSLNPSFNWQSQEMSASWSLSLQQTIWPSPRLSSDGINRVVAEVSKTALEKQRDYVLAGARFKIEELYRSAQLAQARVVLAEAGWRTAQENLQLVTAKVERGEAGELDLISGQLAVLRSERELESAQLAAARALENLLAAVDLAGPYDLEPLEASSLPHSGIEPDLAALLADLEEHPLLLSYQAELERARLELAAAEEAKKPEASLTIRLENAPETATQGGLSIQAAVSIGYPLLDRNQRAKTTQSRKEGLEDVERSYAQALADLRQALEAAQAELARLARDEEIARLNFRQAQLEWEAAEKQYELGTLEEGALNQVRLALRQAQLDYWDACHRHDLAKRRLSQGIGGDLLGGMSR